MAIRDGTRSDLTELRSLLVRANDAPYDAGVVAEEKCFGIGYFGAPRVRVFEENGIRGVAVSCAEYLRILAVDRGYRGRGIGTALLEDSGATVIAAEPGNYFMPGVLDADFFVRRGFGEVSSTWNMHADTSAGRDESRISNLESRIPMLAFVEEHFGSGWRFECERAAIAHYIRGIGFAVAEANNRGLGSFGPMGVAEEFRGHGYGRELLLACLADLRAAGFNRAVIPWTDELEFYRKSCGAEPAHRFVTLAKSL